MPMVPYHAVYGFNSCWVILGAHPTDPCPRCFWWKDDFSDGDVCRLQRGPRKPRWVPWAVSFLFVNNWIIWESAIGDSQPSMKRMILLERWIRWQKLPRCHLMHHCLWGQGFDPADGWQYGGWNLQKGVAEFEEFTQPTSKKRWDWHWAATTSRPWWGDKLIISQVLLRSEKRSGSNYS